MLFAVGAVVSIVKLFTLNGRLVLFEASFTLMRQLLCIHGISVMNVTGLFPDRAEVVKLEQSPE